MSKSRRVSIVNNLLDPNFLERILNTKIDNEKLMKFHEKEHREEMQELTDLKDLKVKSENEVYKALNSMFINKQYFMYCGPILINLNPGPTEREYYLNLENWLNQNKDTPLEQKKPHLYSYMEHVIEALIKEKKDQVVNLHGHIGSGKTFNLVHILEYLCFFHAPKTKQVEFFDIIHKSMQLVHILGSIFRRNNIESSSCGMQIRIGFDGNNQICDFDLKANILDLTLPFSENGRSFSILHSIMTAASSDLKGFLEVPEREISLNFFKKFSHHFNKETKDRFMLNDYEIWNRFHSLLNNFGFIKSEIIEILQLFSFIILCNEASIGKKRSKSGDDYLINKGPATKKLSKNFGINEDDFIKIFGTHKGMDQIKNHLISLMKFTYYSVFEFIMEKVNSYLKEYFAPFIPKKPKKMHQFNDSFSNTAEKKYSNHNIDQEEKLITNIYFIDIPGEVSDRTFGGLLTNLANECQNLFTSSNFMSIIEKLQTEHIEIKYFQPVHSFNVIQSLVSKEGILGYLSRKFTEKNFKSFKNKSQKRDFYKNCLMFVEEADDDLTFDFKFSNKNVTYNYLTLYKESKNCLMTPQLLKLFNNSRNSIIKSQMNYLSSQPKNIHGICIKILFNLFENLKGISPFVIYCLHSNNSYKCFFDKNQKVEEKKIKGENWLIPKKESQDVLKHSIAFPILFWSWYGYNEWIDVEMFVSEFSDDFEKIQSNLNKINKYKRIPQYGPSSKAKESELNMKKINPFEASDIILKVLSKPSKYLIGSQHILFKKGTINEIRILIKTILEKQEEEKINKRNLNGSLLGTSMIPTGRRMSARSIMLHNRSVNPSGRDMNLSMNKSIPTKENNIPNSSNATKKKIKIISNPKSPNITTSSKKSSSFVKQIGINQASVNSSFTKGNISFNNKSKFDKNSSVNGIINTEENFNLNNEKNFNQTKNGTLNNNLIEENGIEEVQIYKGKRSMKNECQIEIIQKVLDEDDNKANQEAKDELGLNLEINEEKAFIKQNVFNAEEEYDILVGGKFSLYHVIDPQKYKHHEFIGSVDITHATHLESQFDIYKNKNNVIVPKNKYFHSIKNLFDYSKIENFGIFDYSNFISEILFIQKSWRKHKVVKKFMIWRYVIRNFLLLQRWIRGFLIRVKFREFKIALKFVKKLQLYYIRRFEQKTKAAIKIQSIVRMKMSRIYYLMKLARKEMHDESDEEEVIEEFEEIEPDFVYEEIEVEVSDDEEENSNILGMEDGIEIIDEKGLLIGVSDRKSVMNLVSNKDSPNYQNYDLLPYQLKKNSVNIITHSRQSISNIKDLNKIIPIESKKTKNKKPPKPKQNKNKLNMKIDPHLPEGKIKKGLNENIFKTKKKVKKIVRKIVYPDEILNTFEKEGKEGVLERAKRYKKKTRIESGYSRYLKKKRNQQNDYTEKELGNVSQSKIDKRNMVNENSIIGKKVFVNNLTRISILEPDKDKRQICELLMKTEAVRGKDNTVSYLNDNFGIIKKNIRDSNKINNSSKRKQKIEDRLLSYGEHVKMKRIEKKIENMKTDANNYLFKPTLTNNSKVDTTFNNKSSIMERSLLYHQEKEEKREMLRNKHQKKEEDFNFRPKINSVSKNIDRTLDNLYDWKNEKERKNKDRIKLNEMEIEINKERQYTPNKLSMDIVKKNNYYNFKKNLNKSQIDFQDENLSNQEEEIEFDLWPEINKTYFKNQTNDNNEEKSNLNISENI